MVGLLALIVYPFALGWFGWRVYRQHQHNEPIDEVSSFYERLYGKGPWSLHLWLMFSVGLLAYPFLIILYIAGRLG